MTTRHRRRIRETQSRNGNLKERLSASLHNLKEAGRVLSSANEEQLRKAQAAIDAVLSSLDDSASESAEATEAKESVRKLAEAYSESADDAGDAAWIISSLLELMADEADEADDLGLLQGAFTLLMQFLMRETAEIGTDADNTDAPVSDYWGWGWESTRARLKSSGGEIRLAAAGKPSEKPQPKTVVLREGKRITTDLVPIHEAAVHEDGTRRIKLIQPGWGSTGYYSSEVLEAGASVFPAGTKMFWDHPTLSEEWERPERSLRDLAAELTTDAVWEANGPAGAGLYADAKVFSPYRDVLQEIAPSIGVSIVAWGQAESGTAEGKSGQIITELVAADSVDFVTYPGAGGQVLPILEAARQRFDHPAPKEATMEVEKDPKFVEAVSAKTAAEQRAARAEEALVLREAKDIVKIKLDESTLPAITRARLAETLASNPPAKEGALDKPSFEAQIAEAIKVEVEYLAKLNESGQIRGMGGAPLKEADLTPALEAGFKARGMSDAAAKVAAGGRS